MQVNITKTKIMIFFLNGKDKPITFLFEGSPLEIVKEYKYLGIDFHYKLSWETCREKMIQGGCDSKIGAKKLNFGIQKPKKPSLVCWLHGLLSMVVKYGKQRVNSQVETSKKNSEANNY
jgi:hypothetical protein